MPDTSRTADRRGLTDEEAAALETAFRHLLSYREALAEAGVPAAEGARAAQDRFDHPLDTAGQAADAVIDALARDALPGLAQIAGPRFFGYVAGASHPVGVAADMLVSAWGQNAATSHVTPAVAAIERRLCDWVIDLLGLPPEAGVGVVTGATVANFAGILAARNALLAARGWDVDRDGLIGAPELPVLIGADAHSAPFAGLRYAGLGSAAAREVETDDQGRMRPEALRAALDSCAAPPLVILQAGQINTGACDPFAEIIPQVHARQGWVHVDGAFGLWLAAAPERAHHVAGVARADSWAVDLHKWLNAPYDAALVITRERGPLVTALSVPGAYLPDRGALWDPYDSTPEVSRRARGVPSYAILRHLGRGGLAAMIQRHCDLAQRIARGLSNIPGVSVLNEVCANQVIAACGAPGPEGDALTGRVLAEVQARGRVYPSHGEWRGRRVMRVSVIGYATQEAEADLLVSEIREALTACA